MKNFKYLLIMVLALTLSVSCSDDDDMNYDENLVGAWEMSETEDGYEFSVLVTFNSNGTGTSQYVETFDGETETDSENFKWSTDGNKLTLLYDEIEIEEETVTYSISGNTLTVGESVFTKV